MTGYIIAVLGIANNDEWFDPPRYLRSWDVEAHDGRGDADLTERLADAHVFASFQEAFDTWRSVPKCRPLRADGEPNRPLTAFHVSVERVLEEQAVE